MPAGWVFFQSFELIPTFCDVAVTVPLAGVFAATVPAVGTVYVMVRLVFAVTVCQPSNRLSPMLTTNLSPAASPWFTVVVRTAVVPVSRLNATAVGSLAPLHPFGGVGGVGGVTGHGRGAYGPNTGGLLIVAICVPSVWKLS